MATIDQNIQLIRKDAIYGRDVRRAIADGIEQLDQIVENREIYVDLASIGDSDYKMTVTNASS